MKTAFGTRRGHRWRSSSGHRTIARCGFWDWPYCCSPALSLLYTKCVFAQSARNSTRSSRNVPASHVRYTTLWRRTSSASRRSLSLLPIFWRSLRFSKPVNRSIARGSLFERGSPMPAAVYGTFERPVRRRRCRCVSRVSRSKLRPTILKTEIKIGGTYRALAPSLEDEVFRIAQEAFANIVRHAKATHATLDLRYHPNDLTLTISDNGVGFVAIDPTRPAKGHFGLQGMHERAEQIGASLNVRSSPEAVQRSRYQRRCERKGMKVWQIESGQWL